MPIVCSGTLSRWTQTISRLTIYLLRFCNRQAGPKMPRKSSSWLTAFGPARRINLLLRSAQSLVPWAAGHWIALLLVPAMLGSGPDSTVPRALAVIFPPSAGSPGRAPRGLDLEDQAGAFAVTFTDVTRLASLSTPILFGGVEQKRYIIETNGCGVAFIDYDNDGWMDLLLLSGTTLEGFPAGKGPTNRLYHNNRDGTFTDVTARSGLDRTGWASAVCAGDYDNDGYDDLFITYWGANVLYHNNGNGTFTDVTARAGLPVKGIRWGSGCTFIDYDRDGRLDLFVANYLKFDPATAPEPGKGSNCVWKGIPVNCGPK